MIKVEMHWTDKVPFHDDDFIKEMRQKMIEICRNGAYETDLLKRRQRSLVSKDDVLHSLEWLVSQGFITVEISVSRIDFKRLITYKATRQGISYARFG